MWIRRAKYDELRQRLRTTNMMNSTLIDTINDYKRDVETLRQAILERDKFIEGQEKELAALKAKKPGRRKKEASEPASK